MPLIDPTSKPPSSTSLEVQRLSRTGTDETRCFLCNQTVFQDGKKSLRSITTYAKKLASLTSSSAIEQYVSNIRSMLFLSETALSKTDGFIFWIESSEGLKASCEKCFFSYLDSLEAILSGK